MARVRRAGNPPHHPDNISLTTPLALPKSMRPAYFPRKPPMTLPMSFIELAPCSVISVSMAAQGSHARCYPKPWNQRIKDCPKRNPHVNLMTNTKKRRPEGAPLIGKSGIRFAEEIPGLVPAIHI